MKTVSQIDNNTLAEILFPNTNLTIEQMEEKFPKRNLKDGARVTRYAPSPTGFMHIGNLFTAFVSERVAHTTDGVFYVRIEDTDKKREVENGVEGILRDLESFGLAVDEGAKGQNEDKGDYGPYRQSMRKDIYHVFAKYMTEQGYAYPCFCTAEELDEIRAKQEAEKLDMGYYGEFAKCRELTLDEIKSKIDAGVPYVVRLKSPGTSEGKAIFDDMIKGKIEMPENRQDIVLLKTDGIPTYHFAHAVDDYLMGTTHVVRGDEWISSAPVHLQLFKCLSKRPPKYAHVSPLMKEENGGKRKLSKRKDPEAAVSFYFEQGYPALSVREYLLTLANSNFEDWRKPNPDAHQDEFPFNFKKMSPSGALFDLVKFNDVSKNVISRMTADEVYELSVKWAETYDKDLFAKLIQNPEFSKGIFSIDRGGNKPRKDIAKWNEISEYTEYFFTAPQNVEMPENVSAEDVKAILEKYVEVYNPDHTKDEWFGAIKEICEPLGFSPDVKAYKQSPESFKGHVGDVSGIIRLAITGRKNTPDLYAIMQLLGKDEVISRLNK